MSTGLQRLGWVVVCSLVATARLAIGQSIWNGTNGVAPNTNWSTAANWLPSGAPSSGSNVRFFDNASAGVSNINNVVDTSFTVLSIQFGQTNGSHTTFIPAGVVLTANSGITSGTEATNATIVAGVLRTNTITGAGGSLVINGVNFIVRQGPGDTTATANRMTLNLSGLGTLTATLQRMLLSGATPTGINRASGRLMLARTNILTLAGTSPALIVGESTSNNGGGSTLLLGQTNVLAVNGIAVGRTKESGSAIRFNSAFTSPTAYIRNSTGTGPVPTWTVGDGGTDSGTTTCNGTADFTLGTVDALVTTMQVGRGSSAGTGGNQSVGVFSFNAGTVQVNTLQLGLQGGSNPKGGSGTMNVNGTAVLLVDNVLELGRTVGGDGFTNTVGRLNINGAAARVNQINASFASTNNSITMLLGSLTITNTAGPGIATLSMGNNSSLRIPVFPSAPGVVVTNLSTSGPSNIIHIASIPSVSAYPTQFALIKYSGLIGGTGNNFGLGSLPAGLPNYTGYISNNLSTLTLDLVLTGGPVPTKVWTAAQSPVWDTVSQNWQTNNVPVLFNPGDAALFDDTAFGGNVILNSGLLPSTVIVNNFTLAYTFSGAGAITGPAGITKQGAGMLTIANFNANTGPTVINGGTVTVDGALGSGNVAVNLGTLLQGNGSLGGPVMVNNGGSVGAGSSGAGTLTATSGLDLSTGGTDIWELAANSTNNPGTDFDQLAVTGGNLVLGGTSRLMLGFVGSATTPSSNDPFWQTSHSWMVIALNGAATNAGSSTFAAIDGTNGLTAGTFSTTVTGNGDVVLNFTPAEPPQTNNLFLNAGFSLIANQLDHGSNTLSEVFGSQLPDGTILTIYPLTNCAVSNTYVYDTSVGISPDNWYREDGLTPINPHLVTFVPGDAAFIDLPQAATLVFTGQPHVPVLPVALACGYDHNYFLGRQTNDIGTYENITGLTPVEGSQLSRWNGFGYNTYTYSSSVWSPGVPSVNVGEAALLYIPLPSYSVPISTGLNLIANQLDHGSNTLNEVLPNMPDGTALYKFNNTNHTWTISSFSAAAGKWLDGNAIVLRPGEGAFLESPGNFNLTFTGTPHVPILPIIIPSNQVYILSRQTNDIGNYDNIVGASPAPGAQLYKWNGGGYNSFTFVGAGWTPATPSIAVGESVWISPSGNGSVPAAPAANALNVLTPSGGPFCPGASVNITWNGGQPAWNINVLLIDFTAWVTYANIALNVPNNGSLSWNIPQNLPAGHTFQIALVEVNQTAWTYGPHFTVSAANPPQITCITNKIVPCGTPWVFDPPFVTPGCCTNVTISIFNTVTNGTCPQMITRTWLIQDTCGTSNLCSQTVTLPSAPTYTLTLHPGQNLIANQLNHGNNTFNDILSSLPDDVLVLKWNCSPAGYTTYIRDSTSPTGWTDSQSNPVPPGTLAPGEGAFINNTTGQNIQLTFSGVFPCPVLPISLKCPCGSQSLVSRQVDCPGTYEDITGFSPQEGSTLFKWTGGGYSVYTYSSGAWDPATPTVGVGEAVFISTPCCTAAPAGLSAWWPFDEVSGPTARDAAGSVNNAGTYVGSPTPSVGMVSNALCFNGFGDSVSVSNQAEVDFAGSCLSNNAESFTIDAWIKAATNGSSLEVLLDKRVNPSAPQGYSVYLFNGHLSFQFADGNGGGVCGTGAACQNYASPGPELRDGHWHFIAITVQRCANGNQGTFYVDGAAVSTFNDPRTGSLANTSNLLIGDRLPAFGSAPYTGCIDELEIFKRALSPSEIQDIYNANSAGKCKTNSNCTVTLNCATNKTVTCGSAWNFDAPTPSAPCCGTNVSVTVLSTLTNNSGCTQITRTWLAMDSCGNSNNCSQTVTLTGTLTVTCPTNKTVPCGTGCVGLDTALETIVRHLGLTSTDGANANGGVIEGPDGAIYGTTIYGGSNDVGVVFKVNKNGTGYQFLHIFGGTLQDGQYPLGTLLLASDGALYGTTYEGGMNSLGSVFKINPDGSGYSQLYAFGGADGEHPIGALIEATNGVLYGTTYEGGAYGWGTVFKLNKNGSAYQSLRSFGATLADGANLYACLFQASDGLLYGTTLYGGTPDLGTAFKLGLNGSGYAIIHTFGQSPADGELPEGGLVEGSDGALYGTTYYGGTNYEGTVYRLTRGATNILTRLHDFNSFNGDGWNPGASLVKGCSGALYSTTENGGVGLAGTVFKINENGTAYGLIHSFGTTNGEPQLPESGVLVGSDGALYGTTFFGGSTSDSSLYSGNGAVYRLYSPAAWAFDPPTASNTCGPVFISIQNSATNGALFTRTWLITDGCNHTNVCSQVVTQQCNGGGSVPVHVDLRLIGRTNSQLIWLSTSGSSYNVEYVNSLLNITGWTALGTVQGNGTNIFLLDPGPLPPMRFYRVRQLIP